MLSLVLNQKKEQETASSGLGAQVSQQLQAVVGQLQDHLEEPNLQVHQLQQLSRLLEEMQHQTSVLGQISQSGLTALSASLNQLQQQIASVGHASQTSVASLSSADSQLQQQIASVGQVSQANIATMFAVDDQLQQQISAVGQASQAGMAQLSQKIGEVLIGAVTTEDDTETTVLSIPIPDLTVVRMEIAILGYKSDGSVAGSYKITAVVKRADTTVSILGTPTVEVDYEGDAAWDVDIAVDSLVIDVNVTGAAATTVNWAAKSTQVSVQ